MKNHNKTGRRGYDLSDAEAHSHDHLHNSRRNFLRTLGLAGAATAVSANLPVTGLFGFPLATSLVNNFSDRKLVMIRLKGGNDGLNTFVPLYNLAQYQSARPTIAHAESSLDGLTAEFGIPPAMAPLRSLWDDDAMRVVNGVGYPDHSLSHFTSSDIMDSGDANVEENGSGWLARHYVVQNPDYRENPAPHPPAVKIAGPASVIFNDLDKIDISANFPTSQGLEDLAVSGQLYDNLTAPDACYYGEQVLFLRTIANAANIYGAGIQEAYLNSTTQAEYSGTLGEQLRLVARLIKGGLNTQLYLVTLDGFDTHVAQNGFANHLGLLEDLSAAVKAFYEDLTAGNRQEEVLAMTYSEFGRRVEENGTGGTDHGQALPVMLFGPILGGNGFHGVNPELDDLDATGNLPFGVDFRSLYATLLEHWLCVDGTTVDEVLGASYPRLPELNLSCGTVSVSDPRPTEPGIRHRIIPRGGRQYQLELKLRDSARLGLEIYTLSGVRLRRWPVRLYPAGTHLVPFNLAELNGQVVACAYSIGGHGERVGGKFIVGGR